MLILYRSSTGGSCSLLANRPSLPGDTLYWRKMLYESIEEIQLSRWEKELCKKSIEEIQKIIKNTWRNTDEQNFVQEYFSLFASAGYDIPTISRMWVLLLHHFIISHFKTTNPWEPPPGKSEKNGTGWKIASLNQPNWFLLIATIILRPLLLCRLIKITS